MPEGITEKKKILVVMPTFYPSSDANTQCVIRILSESKRFRYTVLMERENGMEPEDSINDIEIIRYPKRSIRRDALIWRKSKLFFNLPHFLGAKIKKEYYNNDVNYDRILSFMLEYNHYINIKEYSAIVGFINPIESLMIVGEISRRYSVPSQIMYIDPFFSNETKSGGGLRKRKKLEEKEVSAIDSILATTYVYQDYCNYSFDVDLKKVSINELPGIRVVNKPKLPERNLDEKTIKCYFIGNLYWKIRNPVPLINAFSKVPSDIQLNFVGGCFDGDIKVLLKDAGVNLPNNVHFLGQVSSKRAEEFLWEADILVNIGNTTANQVPSKIFDYMSTGKPILNIQKIEKDPAIPYFEKYPLSLTVSENDLCGENCLKSIIQFCHNNGHKRLTIDDVSKSMPDVTVECVKEKFECNLLKIIHGGKNSYSEI